MSRSWLGWALLISAVLLLPVPAEGQQVRFVTHDVNLLGSPFPLHLPQIIARGSELAAVQTGPTVTVSRDGGRSWSDANWAADPVACARTVSGTEAPSGPADVAIGADSTLHATQNCAAPAMDNLHASSADGRTWNIASGGLPSVAAIDADGDTLAASPRDAKVLWNVSHLAVGPQGVYTQIQVERSDDGGLTWQDHLVGNPLDPSEANQPSLPTRVLVDPTDPRRLCVFWTAERASDVEQGHAADGADPFEWHTLAFAATSSDGGQSWSTRKVLDTGEPTAGAPHTAYTDLAGWSPSGAVDGRGDLFVAMGVKPAGGTAGQVWLLMSTNHGRSWHRRRVDAGTHSAFMPAVAAAGNGKVAVGWLQSPGPDELSPAGRWRLQVATYTNALSRAQPHRWADTTIVHAGNLCPLACAHAIRTMGAAISAGAPSFTYDREVAGETRWSITRVINAW